MYKIIPTLFLLLFFFVSQSAFAGFSGVGGGVLYGCFDSQTHRVTSIEVLDVAGREPRQDILVLRYEDVILQKVFREIAEFDAVLAAVLATRKNDLLKNVRYVYEISKSAEDLLPLEFEPFRFIRTRLMCFGSSEVSVLLAATQQFSTGELVINSRLWGRLSAYQKAALIFHETAYSYLMDKQENALLYPTVQAVHQVVEAFFTTTGDPQFDAVKKEMAVLRLRFTN